MDGFVSTDGAGRVAGVTFWFRQPEVSFARAWKLIFSPDTDMDQPDGLMMLTELDRTGRLSEAERARLREGMRKIPACFLSTDRKVCWRDATPPREQFWWFWPQEWGA